MPEPQSYHEAMGALADEAATLQAKVNLHIGWSVIASQPIPPELCDANAKLVDAARQLRQVAHQAAKVEASGQGIRESERAAPHGA